MKKYIIIVLVILTVISALSFLGKKKKVASLGKNLEKEQQLIRKYQDESGITVDKLAITNLKATNSNNEKELLKISSLFDLKIEEMPKETSDTGLYFFQLLQATMKSLERKAAAKKMVIPPVTFSTDAPKVEEIPYLLKQVKMIEDTMGAIIDAGKCEVETIKPLPIDSKKQMFGFQKISIQFGLNINSDSFLVVLSELNKHIPVYLVESLSITSIDQGRLKINMTVSSVLTGRSIEDVPELKEKQIADLDILYPLKVDMRSFDKRNPFFRFSDNTKENEAGPSKSKVSQQPQFLYKGSIDMKTKLTAIIQDQWQNKACFAVVGDICSGYKVVNIEEKKVTLDKDGQEITLTKGATTNE